MCVCCVCCVCVCVCVQYVCECVCVCVCVCDTLVSHTRSVCNDESVVLIVVQIQIKKTGCPTRLFLF